MALSDYIPKQPRIDPDWELGKGKKSKDTQNPM